jgi:hypothetical protein
VSPLCWDVPPVVEIAGISMAPSLERGWRVRIEPATEAAAAPGEVLLLKGEGGLVLHRVVAVFTRHGERLVFHRGDGGGRIGLARPDAIRGRAVAVLHPTSRPIPQGAQLDRTTRRHLAVARARCRVFMACWRLATATRVDGSAVARAVGHLLRTALL